MPEALLQGDRLDAQRAGMVDEGAHLRPRQGVGRGDGAMRVVGVAPVVLEQHRVEAPARHRLEHPLARLEIKRGDVEVQVKAAHGQRRRVGDPAERQLAVRSAELAQAIQRVTPAHRVGGG